MVVAKQDRKTLQLIYEEMSSNESNNQNYLKGERREAQEAVLWKIIPLRRVWLELKRGHKLQSGFCCKYKTYSQ